MKNFNFSKLPGILLLPIYLVFVLTGLLAIIVVAISWLFLPFNRWFNLKQKIDTFMNNFITALTK